MTVTFNDPIPDPTDPDHLIWDRDTTLGINGRGVKRLGKTTTVASRTTISGDDVSNQVLTPGK